jgi:hypothetical protein
MSDSINSARDDREVLTNQIYNHMKKPKDYFFDFFMLFLAVTLGFFVNNLNENLSERQREKQYMTSLINDLIIDTVQIQEIHSSIKKQIDGIDTLMHILENKDRNNFTNNLYYYSFKYLNSAVFFTSSDRTISQLKSAGGLRLIQKKGESDNIVQYYSSAENVAYNTEYCLKEFYKIMDSEKEIFNFGILRGHKIDSLRYLTNLKLLVDDPLRINHFYNQILMYMSSLMNYNSLITDLKKEAKSLLSFTRENYDIDQSSLKQDHQNN